MPQSQPTRIMSLANQAVAVYQYVSSRDSVPEETALAELKISRKILYRHLLNMQNQPEICQKGRFKIILNGRPLTLKQVNQAREGNQRSRGPQPLERVLYLYQYLQNHTHSGGVDLADLMSLYRHIIRESGEEPAADDAVRRMIYRDIKLLERIHIPVTRPSNGERYALMNTHLPKMNKEHSMLMYVSTLLFKDTLLDEATTCVRAQMEKVCYNQVVSQARSLQSKIRVVGDTLIDPGSFCGCLETIITGLADHKALQFQYLKLDGSRTKRTLEPLGLICKRSVWYLVGMQGKHKSYRTFRVDQIERVRLLEEGYAYPEFFDLEHYLNRSWGVFTNDRVETISVKFSPEVARRLQIVRYHASQTLKETLPDGSVIVEYQVSGLTEMKAWLMQWGDSAEVLAPEGLRGEIKAQVENWLKVYS